MRRQPPRALIYLAALALLAGGAPAATGAITRDVLDNGLVVIASPSETGTIAAVAVLVKASALHEPADKAGLRQLLQQTSVRGSENLSGAELASALDELGAELDAGPALDYVWLSLVCLGQDLPRAMELLAEVVRRPRFAEREVEGRRESALRYVESLRSNPFETAQNLLRQGLYEGHPYSRPTQGTKDSLAAITRSDLVEFHRRYYVPNNTVIAVAGAASRDAVLETTRRHFGNWGRADVPLLDPQPIPALERSTMHLREAPVSEAYLMLGFAVTPLTADTYPVWEVVRSLLGRGMGSRLFAALREKAPAAYQADAYYFPLAHTGCVAGYVFADAAELESAKEALIAEFERLRRTEVERAELERAQEFAVGTYALSHQKARDRAFHLARYEAIGLGWKFDERYAGAIRAVTAAEVRDAARRHFTHYSLGLVLPEN
ncbi:MAG: insulinase family protein [Armatimonadota bacterium]|nr:MAG: insulinase family protein [Armatimonadota bacterium]